jgi:ribosomal protein L11 methyltransferase
MKNPPHITLRAGTAFGSGAHPSTALMLELLGVLGPHHAGGKLLDVGCGSGILSIAAAKLHGMSVVASDLQAASVEQTQQNAQENGLQEKVHAVRANGVRHPSIAEAAPYDVILVNILYEVFLPWLRALHGLLAPEGHMVLSGVLRWQLDGLREACLAAGFAAPEVVVKEDWVACMVRKTVAF